MKNTVNIALIDDHQLFRDGLIGLIEDETNYRVKYSFSSAEEFISESIVDEIDVLITDISLPGISGIELTKKLIAANPDILIIVISMHINKDFIVQSVEAGAMSYLPKDASKSELHDAIQSVNSGNQYYPQKFTIFWFNI